MTYLQETRLRPREHTESARAALDDAAQSMLAMLCKNGQVWGEPLHAWVGEVLKIVALTPYRDSLEPVHHSEWVVRELVKLSSYCADTIRWSTEGTDFGPRPSAADWASCEAFYLFTHALDRTSPVCAGDTGEPAPLYLLPISPRLREDLNRWGAVYGDLDRVWLDSGDLEDATYAQLSELESRFTRDGRAFAAELEQALARPTYYYLKRYHALTSGEESRPCPGCGNPWAQPETSDARGLARFELKCDRCRLISSHGVNVPDQPDSPDEEGS